MSAYASSEALGHAIAQRLRNAYGDEELPRRRNEVAYRRLTARLAIADPERWIIKGGYGLILRLDPNRTSNDIDVIYVDAAGEHAIALAALERACAVDLDDHFSFAITRVGSSDADRALSVAILARLGPREWTRFTVDIARPGSPSPSTPLTGAPRLTGIAEVDALPPGIRVLAWPQQIAEKLCGILERRHNGPSGRVRDLLDLAMVATQVSGLDSNEIREAVAQEVERRDLVVGGPPREAALADDQRAAWRTASRRSTRGAPMDIEDAERIVRGFLDPVLDGSARDARWDATAGAWRSTDEIATAGGSDTA